MSEQPEWVGPASPVSVGLSVDGIRWGSGARNDTVHSAVVLKATWMQILNFNAWLLYFEWRFNTHPHSELKWQSDMTAHRHFHAVMWLKVKRVQELNDTLMLQFQKVSESFASTQNSWWPTFCWSVSPVTCHSCSLFVLCCTAISAIQS